MKARAAVGKSDHYILCNEEFQSSKVYLRSIKNDNHAASQWNDAKLWRNSPSPSPPAPFPSVPPKAQYKRNNKPWLLSIANWSQTQTESRWYCLPRWPKFYDCKQTLEFKFDAFVLPGTREFFRDTTQNLPWWINDETPTSLRILQNAKC